MEQARMGIRRPRFVVAVVIFGALVLLTGVSTPTSSATRSPAEPMPFDTLRGGAEEDQLRGGPGDDLRDGQAGDDRLFGEAGDDQLLGQDGADLLDGGTGVSFTVDGMDPDDTLYDLYRAFAMPTSFFVDPDGVISIVGHGLISLDQMRTAVNGALDGA